MALILLRTGQTDDCNLVRCYETIDLVVNRGPTGAHRVSRSVLPDMGSERKTRR